MFGAGGFLAALHFGLVKPRLQHVHRDFAVLVLAAVHLAGNDDAAGHVGDAHRQIGGVHVLAAAPEAR
jgi:hypothetical protein